MDKRLNVMDTQGPKEKIVLDLETKKSFAEVEASNPELLGVSVVGIYSYRDNQFKSFLENQLKELESYLARAELVIGFNIQGFDFPVLQPYLEIDLRKLNTLDIFEEIQRSLGFRLSLNSIAHSTLGAGKTGTGLDALRYFRQGEIDKLTAYCQNDVLLTRELYEYGLKHSHLIYQRGDCFQTIPVSWAEAKSVDELLQEAFTQHLTVEIEYSSPMHNAGQRHLRLVDIYDFDLGRVVAFCHLRRQLRTFNIRRILSAKLTQDKYAIPANFSLQKYKTKSNSLLT